MYVTSPDWRVTPRSGARGSVASTADGSKRSKAFEGVTLAPVLSENAFGVAQAARR